MAELRKQTVTFKFGEGKAVSNLELWELLKEEWDVTLEELMMVQLETSGKKVHVKFVKQERAEQVAAKERLTLKRRDGSECEVTLQGPGQGVKVLRVRNLPIEVSTEAVMLCLGQYGQVFEVREERYPRGSCYQGLLTGTRFVRMAMKRAVPSYVRISGVEARVFYAGQKPTCQICESTEHLRANCPNRRRPLSWADRTGGRNNIEETEGDGGATNSRETSPAPRTPSPKRCSMPELRNAGGDDAEFWGTPLPMNTEMHVEPEQGVVTEQGVATEQTQGEPVQGVSTEMEAEDVAVTVEERSRASSMSTLSTFEFLGEVSDAEDALASVKGRTLRSESVGSVGSEGKRKRAEEKFEGQLDKLRGMVHLKHMSGHVPRTRSALEKKAKMDKVKGRVATNNKNGC